MPKPPITPVLPIPPPPMSISALIVGASEGGTRRGGVIPLKKGPVFANECLLASISGGGIL
eukprot:CAMPEP_0173176384 /NCGR_PEP_ID=MMETSP1141-20130122/4415_1 /TAXON_ID=483371 /ORGANISM="non described non described, Strain CCMP2298" /LENGTH=60 /DNA_ID=CAMNT_0014098687 /DNA_START=825 /DNA_END=1007 /DNA_ORIENTATION=+